MREPFTPEAGNKLTFAWVQRQFRALSDYLNGEGAERPIKHLVAGDSPYTVENWDVVLLADTAAGAITINLSAGQNERELYIKNIATSGTNAVTVTPNGTDDYDRTGGNITLAAATLDAKHIIYSEQEANWFSL